MELFFWLLQIGCLIFFLYILIYFTAGHALGHFSSEYYSNQTQSMANQDKELTVGKKYEFQQILIKNEFLSQERIDT